jgi:hypothetical protein
MPRHGILLTGVAALAVLVPQSAQSQDWSRREYPLAPPNDHGNIVAPYFDGFYPNEDGTYTLSFGFMNRNADDLIEIPLGPDNYIEPAEYDGMQPTSFPTVSYGGFGGPRERGAFGVVVPEDFEGDVWWYLTTDGYTTRVPGRLQGRFQGVIGYEGAYALSTTSMAEGSLRPTISFEEGDRGDWGIDGVQYPERFNVSVGEPIEVRFWAFDRGERELGQVNMSLWKHQGPVGAVISFESLTTPPPAEGRGGRGGGRGGGDAPTLPDGVDPADLPPDVAARVGIGGRGGRGAPPPPAPGPVDAGESVRLTDEGPEANMGHFRATFDTPGEYVIRIRIDSFSASGDSSPGNQCCWSNAYVHATVTE